MHHPTFQKMLQNKSTMNKQKISFRRSAPTLLIAIGLWASLPALAYKGPGKSSDAGNPNSTTPPADKSLMAGCATPSASAVLEVNNVRTLIHSGGDMWWDLKQFARYEVPKGSGKHSNYLGTLWMGGTDINGILKLAAQRYRSNGVDYYTGPLTEGEAEITPETCKKWDKIWKITREEVALHRLCKCINPASPLCNGYTTPLSISDWPATTFKINTFPSAAGSKQFYVAPFVDVDGDLEYNPENCDYPGYDLDRQIDCRVNRTPYLRGDVTLFWVFNDKGNIHNETQAVPIGMEIRAQAFAFQTNDEINNMTFYNYEIINRGTNTLYNCYFGVNTDADVGYAFDDYTGCDVRRGFGYMYNGNNIDGNGAPDHYGANPPAIGIDFFEGPYLDPNGKADTFNIFDVSTWLAINGLGFKDTIVDNERIGMRRFLYYNNSSGIQGDPSIGIQYYNYLRGFWKNNSRMVFGGTGLVGSAGATSIPSDFMFPGDSDPVHWGTSGVNPGFEWTDKEPGPSLPGNPPGDRRFVQSSGPFTLLPGAVNDITTGVVWARAFTGNPFQSVELVRKADDKAQLLFENCFRIIEGPDAPDVYVQELDREIILYWTNSPVSNNYLNKYVELDYTIDTTIKPESLRYYRFQGYLIYQCKDGEVTANDRYDVDKMRLIAQCDIRDFDAQGNPIARLINYKYDQQLDASIPVLEVDGANAGIFHSLRIQTDAFAQGADDRLVNNKKYYFMVLAYAYNQFKKYDPNDPEYLDGQKLPFLLGRKSASGPIQVYTGMPHISSPENYGTILNSFYGDSPEITRIEGQGNGGNNLDLTEETEQAMLQPPYFVKNPTYQRGRGPIALKVIDPLSLSPGTYYVKFVSDSATITTGTFGVATLSAYKSRWVMLDENMNTVAEADDNLAGGAEQILFKKPDGSFMGLSLAVRQAGQPGITTVGGVDVERERNNGMIEATITTGDGSLPWIGFIPDNDGIYQLNYLLTGNSTASGNFEGSVKGDPNNVFGRLSLGQEQGCFVPYALCSKRSYAPAWDDAVASNLNRLDYLHSVDIVLTPDKSKWSRCPVFETGRHPDTTYVHPSMAGNKPRRLDLRRSPSVDKNGRYATVDGKHESAMLTTASNNPDDPNYISPYGMGWFPGYVLDVETGERLNIGFGEDSWLAKLNGRDMIFNPTDPGPNFENILNFLSQSEPDPLLAGKHFIYIFNSIKPASSAIGGMTHYDEGRKIMEYMTKNNGQPPVNDKRAVFRAVSWTAVPFQMPNLNWLSTEVRIRLRVSKPYARFYNYADLAETNPQNDNLPMYRFSMDKLATITDHRPTAQAALDLINVVPNPYYAYSAYENNKLDNRVRITNLPPECTITIYNSAGTLIKRYTKSDNTTTYLDWDLRNYANIPIASGIYLIHVRVPGMGDRVLKWFGVMRPVDLSGL